MTWPDEARHPGGARHEPAGTGRRPRTAGSFSRSLFGAAARGTGLIALAVAIGIVLLQYSDDPGQNRLAAGREPAEEAPLASPSSTTTTTAGPRPPEEVRVLVLNAARRSGVAGALTERLQVAGYATLTPGNAPTQEDSVVGCQEGWEREAAALVSATGLPAEIGDPGELLPAGADCVVIIGTG